jgi:hypothetical protein
VSGPPAPLLLPLELLEAPDELLEPPEELPDPLEEPPEPLEEPLPEELPPGCAPDDDEDEPPDDELPPASALPVSEAPHAVPKTVPPSSATIAPRSGPTRGLEVAWSMVILRGAGGEV